MQDSNRDKKRKYNKNTLSVYMHENIKLRAEENAARYDMSMSEYFRWLILTDSLKHIKKEYED